MCADLSHHVLNPRGPPPKISRYGQHYIPPWATQRYLGGGGGKARFGTIADRQRKTEEIKKTEEGDNSNVDNFASHNDI